jgi:cytochrome c peroxidase
VPRGIILSSTGRRVGVTTRGLLAILGVAAATAAIPHDPAEPDSPRQVQVPAPGWGELEYVAPEPGTYQLPPLGYAADGTVVDTRGRLRSLHEIFADRIILLAFIYSSCDDPNGCPLATAVMQIVHKVVQDDPALKDRMRLVSLSFDPLRDTPERLAEYSKYLARPDVDTWEFLTTASATELQPILAAYDQPVQIEPGPDGEPSGSFAHILRVFLIDGRQRVRNIYSASFLHRDLVLSDVRTLLLENGSMTGVAASERGDSTSRLSGAGDVKDGYETESYLTRSRSLQSRVGEPADLRNLAANPPLGLPVVPIPEQNPLTAKKIAIGRDLFYDRRLSLNDTFSCAMCHIPEQGFTSNELATAVGIEGRTVRRNSPTLLNVAYAAQLFHDGRENTLEQQVWGPLLARNEMGNSSIGALLEKVRRLADYAGRFETAFGRGPSMETLGMALASYERTLLAASSPFDRWYYGGEEEALSDAAKRGFELFTGKAGCATCHTIGKQHALFTDQRLHNTGLGFRRAMGDKSETKRILVAPGTYIEVKRDVIESVGEPPPSDLGLYEVTQNPADRWKYKTPTLRNISLTAPYMHDGSLATLREVVEFYNRGGVPNENLSPLLHPLGLTPIENEALVAFLESLTGETVDTLVADAFAAKIGDLQSSDPHWSHDSGQSSQ